MTVPNIGNVVQSLINFLTRSTHKMQNNQLETKIEEIDSIFSDREIELMIDAIWRRQKCFIAGDRRFRDYGAILEKLEEMIPYKYTIDEFK